MNLEFDELRSFAVLASELHFRRASERLFLSQPALSKQIRRLEERVGASLFNRNRRKVALTETGHVFRPLADRLLRDAAAALGRAQEAAEGRAGTLRIGFGIASVSELIPRTILRFRRDYPNVELQMRDMSTPSQVAALCEAGIDVAIVRLPISCAEIESFDLFRERLMVVTPRSVRFTPRKGLAALRHVPFIFFSRSASETFHHHALAVCQSAGFTPNVIQEANESFTILNLVRAGLGASLVPASTQRMRVPGVTFHHLRLPEAEWRIGVAWHRLSEKRQLIGRFTDTIRKCAEGISQADRR